MEMTDFSAVLFPSSLLWGSQSPEERGRLWQGVHGGDQSRVPVQPGLPAAARGAAQRRVPA